MLLAEDYRSDVDAHRGDRQEHARRWLGVILLLLAALLVFAHGCHGDEDSELFTRLQDETTVAAFTVA
jgi:hypothetical protein